MSIFTKVLALFALSLALMVFVSKETSSITQSKIELLYKEKYQQASNQLFKYLSNNDSLALRKTLQELNFSLLNDKQASLDDAKIIFESVTSFGEVKIYRDKHGKYLLFLNYLDESLLLQDTSQEESLREKQKLEYLIYADIAILLMIFILILKILLPLKTMSQNIRLFGEGALHVRMKDFGNDELGELSKTFNAMAHNIESLLEARQRLLRDIGHELRTPIAKSKLALEMIPQDKHQKMLQKAIFQIDKMTAELLTLEKLNANTQELQYEVFSVQTLILEALSLMFIEDESLVEVRLSEDFSIKADKQYLCIALKNLIDNAMKYATQKPIIVEVEDRTIWVRNQGEALEGDLEYYCQAFAQGENSRTQEGFGLGLSIVKKITDRHGFTLKLTCKEGYTSFGIEFGDS